MSRLMHFINSNKGYFKHKNSARLALVLSCILGTKFAYANDENIPLPENKAASTAVELSTHHIDTLNIHDPAILADPVSKTYYVYDSFQQGSKYDKLISKSGNSGVQVYWSKDLINWQGPKLVYEIDNKSWSQPHYAPWAPEVSYYQGKYYLFTTLHNTNKVMFKPKNRPVVHQRGTQIFVSDSPFGPFKAISEKAQTPVNEMALDGTLWVEDGQPWMIYCQEWLQVGYGLFKAIRLTPDLSATIGEPITLFSAADANWTERISSYGEFINIKASVSDGPWPYRTKNGKLVLMWSSWNKDRTKAYTTSLAYSDNGKITGNWIQADKPLIDGDIGHGNIFKTFDGELRIALHRYFNQPFTRLQIYQAKDTGDSIEIGKQILGHP
ncbi:glycoside hydrolase family 43 protein [Catenovulum sp. 2E275]|uniref:glycoside hydrolase family 43 protein n=1 Tax=Catenovulum sp. 2E275 TaxID=2980497 RepID=UPI0021D0BB5C|nr:glycoside hydrolase family 43 protein [Catenovulum sp. 2E275]MCU4677294.1 glycoside hydrolase family 43 protein [Catenovulum sp. 2E275]